MRPARRHRHQRVAGRHARPGQLRPALDRAHRASFTLREALEREKAKTEELLYNVLPPTVARRLREGEIVADSFSDASVIFIDVIGMPLTPVSVAGPPGAATGAPC